MLRIRSSTLIVSHRCLLWLHLRLTFECPCTLELDVRRTAITTFSLNRTTYCFITLKFIFLFSCCTAMDGVFPYLIELLVFTSHIVVKYWLFPNCFQSLSRMLSVIRVFAWRTHLDHIEYILCVGIFLLFQIKCFEFLAHRGLVALVGNITEWAQWFLFTTINLGITLCFIYFS